MIRFGLAVLFFMVLSLGYAQEKPGKILIAAAADLKFAMDSIASVFMKDHPSVTVDVVYGSSGKLFEQISHGAPFHIFFSADIKYPEMLSAKGLTSSEIITYGYGRLVLWSRNPDVVAVGLNGLTLSTIKKVAIANPLHAPYGKSAEEVLRHHGLYDKVKSKLVFGENISQTAQFVTSGAADAGLIAYSLALSPNMKRTGGTFYLIPENEHQPLQQGFVLLSNAKDLKIAYTFEAFMKGEKTKAILTYFGFLN